jgi:hypothetical protein
MPSPIQVTEKTIHDRDVISIRKEYGGDEHEVMCPVEDGIQLLFNIMSLVNDTRDKADEFVLVRKSDVGRLHRTDGASRTKQSRKDALAQVTTALFDEQIANDVVVAVDERVHESADMSDGGRSE